MSACVTAFQAFLKENQTGLIQRTPAWVKARKHTIGASEMAVLTRASPFDTPASLVRKKLHPIDLSQNVACAWGRLFESFAREYIEWKHNTKVFGHSISLNLAKSHPLYGKVTCSPDGYFQALDESLILLEIKCPFKRKIAVNKIPAVYRDQGFRMRDGSMYTYEQRKLGLSAYYDKRWVLPDGIHTEPLEYHQ